MKAYVGEIRGGRPSIGKVLGRFASRSMVFLGTLAVLFCLGCSGTDGGDEGEDGKSKDKASNNALVAVEDEARLACYRDALVADGTVDAADWVDQGLEVLDRDDLPESIALILAPCRR